MCGSSDELEGLACTDPTGTPGTIMLLFRGQAAMPACATGRFIDLGLTVHDTQTGLEWEKKVAGAGCLHCVDDSYTWCAATSNTAGVCAGNAASWIRDVNREGFAGQRDWRVPTVDELQTILLEPFPCDARNPCIDPIFDPTASAFYWSATEGVLNAASVGFADGFVGVGSKNGGTLRVRAVRGGP